MVGLQDEACSFPFRLQPELDQATDGFRAGLDIVLFDPIVQRFKLGRLEADKDAFAAPSR
jgi:hypothetical protein